MTTLSAALHVIARRTPEKVAVVSGDRSVSYGALDLASRVGGYELAARGVGPGDRILILLPNMPQFVVAVLSAYRCGAVIVPLNPLLRADEVRAALDDCGARMVITWAGVDPQVVSAAKEAGALVIETAGEADPFDPWADQTQTLTVLSEPDPAALAALLYTSATTGKAKGAMLSHGALFAAADAYRQGLSLEASDIQVAFLPLFHSFGMSVILNASIIAGGTIVLSGRFEPSAAVDLIASSGATVVAAVTPMFAALIAEVGRRSEAPNFSRVRLVGGGATSIPPDLASRLVAAFGAKVVQGWGLSETGAAGTFTPEQTSLALGDIGVPLPGVEVRIVDGQGNDVDDEESGEIWIRGRTRMDGYYANPQATAEAITSDGWLRSGDIGRRSVTGSYFFQDRIKELIKRSGYNVYPAEIEAILYKHPQVKLAAVIGLPDQSVGEEVAAVVVRSGPEPIDIQALRQWVKDQVAPYKYPRFIAEAESLPLAPSGKIVKRRIDRIALFPDHYSTEKAR